MKTTILLALFSLVIMQAPSCEDILEAFFSESYAPVNTQQEEDTPRGYLDLPDENGRCELIMPGRIPLYERPVGVWHNAFAELPPFINYGLHPVEYTYYAEAFWYKVKVDVDIPDSIAPPAELTEHHWGYVWIAGPPPDPTCEGALPLTDGIEDVGCRLSVLPEDRIAARVGPGIDRAIFRYLTSADGTLTVDGHVFDIPFTWYRIVYNDQRLWISNEDRTYTTEFDWLPVEYEPGAPGADKQCFPPSVAVPPIPTPPPEGLTTFQDFPVYHCRHLGSNQFEWVSARVTFDSTGLALREDITGGPFQGEWRDGCPAGDIAVQSDPVGEPPPIPTPLPGN